jgi:hypothetical protein
MYLYASDSSSYRLKIYTANLEPGVHQMILKFTPDPAKQAEVFEKLIEFTLLGPTGVSQSNKALSNMSINSIFPNPVQSSVHLDYNIGIEGMTKLYITDIKGRIICTLVDQVMGPGNYLEECYIGDIAPPGLYFIILQQKNTSQIGELIISK